MVGAGGWSWGSAPKNYPFIRHFRRYLFAAISGQFSAFSSQRMKDFRQLKVWQKAHKAALAVYDLTRRLPKDETYGLTSQIRRAASSIPANIAEGCGRGSDAELARFLYIAMGSALELEYHLLLARDLNYFEQSSYDTVNTLVIELKRMLAALIGKVAQPKRTTVLTANC